MGFFWSVIFPIINLAIYTFVFRLVLNSRWSDSQGPEEVILVMFAGIVIWNSFGETLQRSTNTLVENSNLIQKVVFPSEILPGYLAISSWINMCIGLPFVVIGVAYFAYVSPLPVPTAAPAPGDPAYQPLALGMGLLSLPLLFALQLVFSVGLGYFMSTLNLLVRDTMHLVGVLVTVWMFSTPIFYPAVMVQKAGYGWVLDLNPMYWLIESYRTVLLHGRWPDPALLGRFAAVAAIVFVLGSKFFMANKRRFPDLL